MVGLIGVFGIPRWFINKLTARRQTKFIRELPNAIDIVVRGMKSGLPLNECLAIIARESEEPLAGEFREVIEQQRVGVSLGEALQRLAMRMPLPEVKFLSIVVAIQQQAGGNLSEALGNLSTVLRDRFQLKMKVKALSAEAKASAWVLASLPPIVTLPRLWDGARVHLRPLQYAHWQLCAVVLRPMDADGHPGDAQDDQLQVLSSSVRAHLALIREVAGPAMHLIDTFINPTFIVTILTAICAFATVLTITMPMLARDRMNHRMRTMAVERDKMRAERLAEMNSRDRQGSLRQTPKGFMQQIVTGLNLRKMLDTEELRDRLKRAGLRGQAPLVAFMFFRVAAPASFFLGAIFYLFVLGGLAYPPLIKIMMALAAAFLGSYAPSIFIENLIQKRQTSIKMAFPDALDMLLICVQSGMSVEAAFGKVSKEVAGQSLELAEELSLTTAELSYLQDRRQAFDNLGKRTGIPGVKAVTTALIQAERYGTPVGQALRVMAKENRDIRQSEAEKKAASLPPKLTVPMIIFFLPVLFVVILGPAAISYWEWG